jgi:hypothetical protein
MGRYAVANKIEFVLGRQLDKQAVPALAGAT